MKQCIFIMYKFSYNSSQTWQTIDMHMLIPIIMCTQPLLQEVKIAEDTVFHYA